MSVEKKIEIIKDKKMSNTVEIIITGEGHTLGNLLTEKLLEDKRCLFSAYKVLHPLTENVNIKVTAIDSCDVIFLVTETLKKISNELKNCIMQCHEKETVY
ncbi:DNA-directed RNA polymerase II core subunit [Binucleata daphniae]